MALRPALNHIGGAWVESSSHATVEDRDPAHSDRILANATASTAADIRYAIDAAAQAFPEWRATPAPQRGDIVRKAADLMERRRDQLARLLTQEEGKVLAESFAEVDRAIANVRFSSGQGTRLTGETIPSAQRGTLIYTTREPLGVVACVTPWNFPIAIPAWKIAPALVAGNTVVFKPASLTPLCATEVVQCFLDAGLPDGVLNLVLGSGEALSSGLVDDERIKAISFTGSSAVGRALYAQAAKRLCKVQLEMGGKNAVIVLADADLEKAAESVASGAFGATGQRCTATSRAVVAKPLLADFVKLLGTKAESFMPGDGLADGVKMGPLVDASQLKKVRAKIADGKREGATLVRDGTDPGMNDGYFVAPTIFTEVDPRMSVAQDEIFGPVVSVIPADDLESALAKANAVGYGLSSSIYTRDLHSAFRYAEASEAGMLHVNLPTLGGEAHVPFGGIKDSGFGDRECGTAAFDFFTEQRVVYVGY
ncbi:MAG TPA: aldehyde dehydrogenase family protein [Candidatus Saccharimonadales bacterium]|nr:aldehyde dehydrogenase family protein [Candidatus Saccharimonadales bacterium]